MTHDDVYNNNACANDDDIHSPQESRSVNSFAFKKSIRTTVECRSSLLEKKIYLHLKTCPHFVYVNYANIQG